MAMVGKSVKASSSSLEGVCIVYVYCKRGGKCIGQAIALGEFFLTLNHEGGPCIYRKTTSHVGNISKETAGARHAHGDSWLL